jgi:thiol:disulfide interchange protein
MKRFLIVCLMAGVALAARDLPRPAGDPVYNPEADPKADLQAAMEQAAREGKHILMEVGGEWCVSCHRMDAFFVEHAELLALRKKNYVFMKVNMSEENENKEFLSRLPAIDGYPHLFVLDASGELLHSQNTGKLEEAKSYSLTRFMAFLEKWSPKAISSVPDNPRR